MRLTGREAASRLRDVLSSDEQVRLLLRTGIAGEGTAVGRALTYDEGAIENLRVRRRVDDGQLACACPYGLYVARLARDVTLDLTRPWGEVAAQVSVAVAGQRPPTPLTAAVTSVRIRMDGSLPFVATFLGYVVLAADLVAFRAGAPVLESPGRWARVVTERRMRTARGGRPAYVWAPPVD